MGAGWVGPRAEVVWEGGVRPRGTNATGNARPIQDVNFNAGFFGTIKLS